ncbi:hypothetical protein NBRC111893_2008 [Lentilactobacillus kosonis]|uniref:Uncharacterized protein n=1 Tax=Lentilactobacillus kosonis TaxID=2810561 RepID=A0A401FN99_9LACO|nr:hypothetical protein NBRC111893_2008 [Lentilactobacillus kosonis]
MSLSIIHLAAMTISGTQSRLADPVDTSLGVISSEKSLP